MRDPLQRQPTPYELLQIPQGASKSDLKAALAVSIARKRAPVADLTRAWQTLNDDGQRAMVDLFIFDPSTLGRLVPNPLTDPGCLDRSNRLATATKWEAALRPEFPNPAIAHALAVLWYWWAVSSEESPGASGPGEPATDELWRSAIAYWTFLSASDLFWKSTTLVPSTVARQVRREVLPDKLATPLAKLTDRGHGTASAKGYRALSLALETEKRVAHEMTQAGINNGRGTLSCGPLMLERSGLLDGVRREIESQLAARPDRRQLHELRALLSPYAAVEVMLRSGKAREALGALGKLRADERTSAPVRSLRARALHAQAEEQAGVGDYDAALKSWGQAYSPDLDQAVIGKIRAGLVSAAKERAASLRPRDLEGAVLSLEQALSVLQDPELTSALAADLHNRAVASFNSRSPATNNIPTSEDLAVWEKALTELERAHALGSPDAEASVNIVRECVEYARRETQIPHAARKLIKEADEPVSLGDWPLAVQRIRAALKEAGAKAPLEWKKLLGICLSNMAVAKIDRAVEMVNTAVGQRDPYSNVFPYAPAVALLEEARSYLSEAERCDPSNEQIQKNAAHVRTILGDLTAARESFNHASSPAYTRSILPPDFAYGSSGPVTTSSPGSGTTLDNLRVQPQIPELALRFIEAANAAISVFDWAGATANLRMALQTAHRSAPPEWSHVLGVCLANGAVEKANRAIGMLTSGAHWQSRALLNEASAELQEAQGWDPTNAIIRKHAAEVRAALEQLGDTYQADLVPVRHPVYARPQQPAVPLAPYLDQQRSSGTRWESILWHWPLNDPTFWGFVGLLTLVLTNYCGR